MNINQNPVSKNEPRTLEISPLKDEWLRFWIKMDEIDAWEWDKKYIPPENVFEDGRHNRY